MIRLSILVFACMAFAPVAGAQITSRVSVSSAGAQADNNSQSRPSISADGRYVAFSSWASNLVAGDTNDTPDIFVYDRQTGATSRVSLSSGGAQSNDYSYSASISGDGRYVAFRSNASNLVVGDTNACEDVFVHDRQTGLTNRVSVSNSGEQGNSYAGWPSISADGRYVAFESTGSNLVAGDTNGCSDLFIHDRQSGSTSRVSISSVGAQGNGQSYSASISADGRSIGFVSTASNLVAGDTNGFSDIFVHDRQNGTTRRVSISSASAQGNGDSPSVSISADARFVAFSSRADNLVDNDSNGFWDVFIHDCQSGATSVVSVSSAGVWGNDGSGSPSISAEGRYVAFDSAASNFVVSDTNNRQDVFLHDRQSGVTTSVSVSSAGALADDSSFSSSISADGSAVSFTSVASNLVAGDTNDFEDVFVHDRQIPSPPTYCTAGTTVHGCVPSISGVGSPSSSSGAGFDILVSSVPGQKFGTIFYGFYAASVPWSQFSPSFRCVAYPIQRTGDRQATGTPGQCDGVMQLDFNAWLAAHPGALGQPFVPGQVFYAQGWFRDPGAPKQTNLSNALMFILWD